MTPTKFTVKDGTTHFHYNGSELREFIRRGKEGGNVGLILIRRRGNMLIYKGFGTIENPMREMITISMMYNPLFDGRMPTDEERLAPPKYNWSKQGYSFEIMDFGKQT